MILVWILYGILTVITIAMLVLNEIEMRRLQKKIKELRDKIK